MRSSGIREPKALLRSSDDLCRSEKRVADRCSLFLILTRQIDAHQARRKRVVEEIDPYDTHAVGIPRVRAMQLAYPYRDTLQANEVCDLGRRLVGARILTATWLHARDNPTARDRPNQSPDDFLFWLRPCRDGIPG